MGVDVSKIADGDWITVRVRAFRKEGSQIYIREGWGDFALAHDTIVGHEPAPRDVRPGDRVTVKDGRAVYRVLAVHEGRAWLDDAAVPLRNPCRALEELRIVK